MNTERQLIGSLLIDSSRIEDMSIITSEMFTDPILSEIFSIYEHSDGKEINQLVILNRICTDVFTEEMALKFLADIINEHDAEISDKYSAEVTYNNFRAKKLYAHMASMNLQPSKIDDIIFELKTTIDGLERDDTESDIQTISELTKYQNEYFTDTKKAKYNLGFKKLDDAIGGLDNGDTLVIAARPAVGKSAFTLQIIRKFGRDGIKTGYFNLEMSKKQIYERAIASASGIEMNRIRRGIRFLNNEKQLFKEGNEKLKTETNVHIISGTQTIKNIRAIQKKNNFQIIVIDYLQLINPDMKRNGNRAAEVGDISRGLKAIARDFNIPVIALSQLNRVSELNRDKEPTMSELRESGDIEQDASVILMLWNPNIDDASEKMIKVEKSRNGYTDRLKLYFDGKHMTFSEFDVNEEPSIKSEEGDLPWS